MGTNQQSGPDRLTARTKWRMRAVEILYEAESRGESAKRVLAERADRAFTDPEAPRLPKYAEELVRGVDEYRYELDEAIGRAADGWAVERMPAVDRNVLRVALYEIIYVEDVDTPVAIKEAMRVAEQIGSSDDTSFVNAVLDAAAKAEE
ncbi:transcription antitermination factor NusB [Glycomyces terrestris]|uniref:Transcription antitermination protein NusB n=1 Tax=Glycomyces terrestris TaxID=2493553 RepID=A0A426V1R3_9ACTN|nr:transcription antitermination factor NusB [Glycomyces terrestris]RRS00786.1 transcription antitermination factor NusB [Glycomyces terrestris]